MKELTVTLHGKQIGTLTQDESGKLSFAYSENKSPILSLTLLKERLLFPLKKSI